MPTVRFEPSGKSLDSPGTGETLMELAERAGICLDSVCGGRGTCGRCRIIVKKGDIPITEDDREHLSDAELDRGMRLACQITVLGDMLVEIPGEFIRGKQIILEDSLVPAKLDPVVRWKCVRVPGPSLESPVGDLERLLASLGVSPGGMRVGLGILRSLPERVRGDESIFVVHRREELIDLAHERGFYGMAVDLGTTTVVAYLMDLRDGSNLATSSDMNPQIAYGDDVVSRITFTMERPSGRSLMKEKVVDCLNRLVHECCRKANVYPEHIYEMVIVGNTAMHHLLMGIDGSNLTFSPYVPVISSPLDVRSKELGLKIAENGYLHTPPNVAGFVGSDHVSALLSCRLWEMEKPTLLMDVGTNGEISLGCDGMVLSASTAAGPAFEGANLTYGMRATSGAIDSVSISEELDVSYTTIHGERARGLCGSGVVDALSEMLLRGIIDTSGRIVEELATPRIRVRKGEAQFILADEGESANGEAVSLSQNDVVQIQYAKAAMYAGARVLMERMGIDRHELDTILLAGAFGNYISIGSARTIGLFPEVPLEKVRGIGNAAGAGARMMLLDGAARKEAERLMLKIDYVELAAQADFEDMFFHAMYLPHHDLGLFPEIASLLPNA